MIFVEPFNKLAHSFTILWYWKLKRPLHGATWGRIMWALTHELRTLWPQSVYMAGVPACITDKSLTSCWPEIRMYWRQRPLLCINIYIYIYIYIYYIDIILLNLNKREKSEAKWEKTCPCLQILSLHFEIIFTALTWNNFLYTVQWDFAYIDVQCRKCQANVLSTSK